MPAPWEMNYGPYMEEELRRREVGRRALGMPEVSPAIRAGELYGVEQARLGEKRQYLHQAVTNWQNQQNIDMARKQQSQRTAGQAVSGVANLALTGYKAGKELGLWGKEAVSGPIKTGGADLVGQTGDITSQVGGGITSEAVPGTMLGESGELIPASEALTSELGSIPSITSNAGFGATGPMEAGLTIAGAFAPEAVAGGGQAAITGVEGVLGTAGVGAELLAPEVIGAGTEAVVGANTAVETGLSGVLGLSSIAGPVVLVIGGVLSILSFAFGDELGKLFG